MIDCYRMQIKMLEKEIKRLNEVISSIKSSLDIEQARKANDNWVKSIKRMNEGWLDD